MLKGRKTGVSSQVRFHINFSLLYVQAVKGQASLRRCADLPDPSLFDNASRIRILKTGSINFRINTSSKNKTLINNMRKHFQIIIISLSNHYKISIRSLSDHYQISIRLLSDHCLGLNHTKRSSHKYPETKGNCAHYNSNPSQRNCPTKGDHSSFTGRGR